MTMSMFFFFFFQIVAGVIYTLNVEIGKTDCKKGTTNDIQSCSLMQDSHLAQVSNNSSPSPDSIRYFLF